MRRLIIQFLSAVLFFCVLTEPICVFATSIDNDKKCNLTLTYSKNDIVFSDLEINIYRVADCNFEKTVPFDKYPVSVNGIKSQTEWNSIATTFSGFIQSEKITPYKTAKTDGEGKVLFESIDVGLYLIAGVTVDKENRIYTFFDSMLFLPIESDSEYLYDVSVKLKSDESEATEKIYSILKLWKDDGYINRPQAVTVDILKDGEKVDTVVLDSSNNWQYTFKTTDVKSNWSVVEKNISSEYTVAVTEKESTFVIVNTKKDLNTPPSDIPQTGDTSHIELYSIIFCISGLLIIVCGIGIRRVENASEK